MEKKWGRERERQEHERMTIKVLSSAVHSSAHCQQRRQSQREKEIHPLKGAEEDKKKGKRSGENTCWLSLGPPRGNDKTLSFTSAADGTEGPSTLICLLSCHNTLHLSPPFLSSPPSSLLQAVPVIGCPMVLDLVLRLCVSFFEATLSVPAVLCCT